MGRIDDFKGCCDNGCVIKRPKGMGTNAKCRCPDYKLRAFIHALKTEIIRLREERLERAKLIFRLCREIEGREAVVEAAKERIKINDEWCYGRKTQADLDKADRILFQALSDMEGKEAK